jgi:hypothetical protein
VAFHILGSSIASLNEIEDADPFTADAKYFLVKNYFNNAIFFEWDQATHSSYFKNLKEAVEITVPKLNEMAYEQVRRVPQPIISSIRGQVWKPDRSGFVCGPVARCRSATGPIAIRSQPRFCT